MIEELDDVGAAELRGRFRPALEARADFRGGGGLGVNELHGAGHVEPHVLGEPDRAHPSLPEGPLEPEAICHHDSRDEIQGSPFTARPVSARTTFRTGSTGGARP